MRSLQQVRSKWKMTKIGKHSKFTHGYATIFLEPLKLKISRNYRQQNCPRDYRKNQCPWCGLIQQGSTSVHRKFCMKMPIRMWLARQRATSRSYNEDGNGQPCCHCGSVYAEAHVRARHEKQCGERFAVLGLERNQGDFILTSWEDTGLSEEIRIKYSSKFPGLCTP